MVSDEDVTALQCHVIRSAAPREPNMETVLLADNARISRQLVEVQTKLDLAEAVAAEKIQHLESTIQALTRQSTNDAFTSAKR